MAHRIDHLKDSLVEKVAVMIADRQDAGQAGPATRFTNAFFASAAAEDIAGQEDEALYAKAMSLFAFAQNRAPGAPLVRVFRPEAMGETWAGRCWVINIVNDDMPFLVDSVSAALQRLDVKIHLMAHPVMEVERDGNGRLLDLRAKRTGGHAESLMHIEVGGLSSDAGEALAGTLSQVLVDIRAAVDDWGAMRTASMRAAEMIASPSQEAEDARAFLSWCHDDHFTFLGYRCYRFEERDGTVAVSVKRDSGLGLLRDPARPIFTANGDLAELPAGMLKPLVRSGILLLNKSESLSTVHRTAPMDLVGVKIANDQGRIVGLHLFAGLYTASVYTLGAHFIPLLKSKIARIQDRAGFAPDSHDGRALRAILEGYPRDELLQTDETTLYDISLQVLRLMERPRVALFLRQDEFGRFLTAQMFAPRDRYDANLRVRAGEILSQAFDGEITSWHVLVADGPLARVSFVVKGKAIAADMFASVEEQLAELARSWADRLQEALIEAYGDDKGLALFRRYGRGFPASYTESTDAGQAILDIERIEAVRDGIALRLFPSPDGSPDQARFKIYRAGNPVPLSDVLPLFEHLGFRVISEEPHTIRQDGEQPFMIQDFRLAVVAGTPVDIGTRGDLIEQAFLACWQGLAEDDGFNRLIARAGLSWRQVSVLRAYSKYLRQAGSTFSQAYVENSIAGNPEVAAHLVRLFETRFDPAMPTDAPEIEAVIEKSLEAVQNADEDRILRRFLDMLLCTLRTNYFQRGPNGALKPVLSLKLDSRRVQGLPLPRPMVEIFVYSPRVEGIHLRGGKVARGGIRWSDRPEDFRTEILGLMKAQMVKNAVIVPVGSKGGFVVKRPPATREAMQEEGIACYRAFIGGLLDITDNLSGGTLVPPPDTARRDGDDPYLVVAADKGTATFSDIANGVSQAYGFWLDDAFASGGSQGYDHKVMGITARGAWTSIERHFREMGHDVAAEPFSVVGVGDMSGDVFGNGMLRSKAIRLVAAFDHRHIFIDPNPDPARSFEERARLFALPRSSWADYDPSLLSPGGAIIARSAKIVRLTPQAQALFDIETDILTPTELIKRLLTAKIDLLWFGGIGTYVKASTESQADAGDRTNDAVRVDAKALHCRVIGEGANLAVTQEARIEFALEGGRCNTDAIDNSAGVDCSDHEVNIKILLNREVAGNALTLDARNVLLAAMTDDVAALVLRDNYLQTQAISVFEAQAPVMLDQQDRFMRLLERMGRLDRSVEHLPTDEELARRAHAGKGLTRPEIAVLLAYGKLWLYDAVLESDLPDDPVLLEELIRYFPQALRTPEWQARMRDHRLHREIIATAATNSIANRVGGSFVARIMETTGAATADVVRAYLIVRDVFGLRDVWDAIEGLDKIVPASIQTTMLIECNRLLGRGIEWVLNHSRRPLEVGRLKSEMQPGIAALRDVLESVLPTDVAAAVNNRAQDYGLQGVPRTLAYKVASLIVLASANDIAGIAQRLALSVAETGRVYFAVGTRFHLGWLRATAERLTGGTHWHRTAIHAVIDALYERQAKLTAMVATIGGTPEDALAQFEKDRKVAIERVDQLLGELRASGTLDLSGLIVASHQFDSLDTA